jgi:hypothetical protein
VSDERPSVLVQMEREHEEAALASHFAPFLITPTDDVMSACDDDGALPVGARPAGDAP